MEEIVSPRLEDMTIVEAIHWYTGKMLKKLVVKYVLMGLIQKNI
ncbi:hypothetical protein ACQCVK_21455 [Rossellomorea vietnamensis]